MKKLISLAALAAFLVSLTWPVIAAAQEAQKCEGPQELCAQVLDLKAKLDKQRELTDKKEEEKSVEKRAAVEETKKKDGEKAAVSIAVAASMAVILKLIVSMLQSWKGYFTTDKQKAGLKIGILVVGFVAFLLTNRGLGMDWWQAVIIAGGGPGAMLVHDLQKLIPVLFGKKKYESKSDPPAPSDEAKKEGEELSDKLEPKP